MTQTSEPARRPLPLAGAHSGRSAMTCQYKCGDACSHPVPNGSDNEYFGDVVSATVSRRGLLKASAVGAVVTGIGFGAAGPAAAGRPAPDGAAGAAAATAGPGSATRSATGSVAAAAGGPLTFSPIPPNTLDTVVVPNGYDSAVVIRWGEQVLPGAPAFSFDRQTPQAQARQFGYNNDFVALLPLGHDGNHALLWANHEYTNEELMFRGYTDGTAATVDQIRIAMAAHGGSIVAVERVGRSGRWVPVRHGHRRFNRRLTATTPMAFTGAATGSPLLRTAADPTGRRVLGMLNNCAGGTTPWGTVLTCEENFNQYFVGGDAVVEAGKAALRRYGIDTANRYPSGSRHWDKADARFDLAAHPNEANRFGYVVEVDPYEPDSTPRKHTALGRFKHEAANIAIAADGRVAVYMGDDERFDYVYKFVSSRKYRAGSSRSTREWNKRLLEDGTLYVARFTGDSPPAEVDGSGRLPADGEFDGSGVWVPLAAGGRSLVDGFTIDQVLVQTRLAADTVGATKMDRPEDIEVHPRTGKIYAALTNNTARTVAQVDEANPRPANRFGHILEITETGGDAAATTFAWALPIVCGNPADPTTYFAGFDKTKVSPISCPDNVAFDGAGNLWIATDGNPSALGANDGLFAVPLDGPDRGHLRQFATVPVGAEACGPLITPDQRTAFVAVQHPGEVSGASVDTPKSTWPDGGPARPAVVAIWRIAPGSARIGA